MARKSERRPPRTRSNSALASSRAPPKQRCMRTAAQSIRISLTAPNGRMGKAIAKAVAEDSGFALDQDRGDVLIDFSAPDALQASLDRAVSAGVPILIGTTGLQPEHHSAIA